jgi:hypothetical protein
MELTIYHGLIIAAFIGVVIWAFGRKRKARFEEGRTDSFRRRQGLRRERKRWKRCSDSTSTSGTT